MRSLGLTSPSMRGTDVVHLQQALNQRRAALHQPPLHVDGIYGPTTAHAVHVCAYELGLNEFNACVGVIRRIEHPGLRGAVERERARERAKRAAARRRQHGSGPDGALHFARTHIGVSERPPGSNWGEPEPAGWIRHCGFNGGVSWCGCFARAAAEAGGAHLTSRCAFCPSIEADARSHTGGFEAWHDSHQQARPGDLVLYCWDRSGVPEHVGVVESIHASHVVSIEGNTSGTNASDGGMVARMSRPYLFAVGYARPRY